MDNFSSDTIVEITNALISVQSQLRPVPKDATNPFLHNRYASLSTVLDVVRRPLLDNGILLVQRVIQSEPCTVAVETRLIHNSGEWFSGITTIPLPNTDDTKSNLGQAVGAAISYARRYGLMSMLSLAAVDDDSDLEVRPQPSQTVSDQSHVHTPAPTTVPYGLPEIPNVNYESGVSDNGEPILIARGQTLQHKDTLKRNGFRWNPDHRYWAVAQSA